MPEGTCAKCGWKAPAGLLKCPFCKTYIRQPGSSSSNALAVPLMPVAPDPSPPPADASGPGTGDPFPPVDPSVVREVQRALGRELFNDSSYEWPAAGREAVEPRVAEPRDPDPEAPTEDGEPPDGGADFRPPKA